MQKPVRIEYSARINTYFIVAVNRTICWCKDEEDAKEIEKSLNGYEATMNENAELRDRLNSLLDNERYNNGF
jgi:hypothetical protein